MNLARFFNERVIQKVLDRVSTEDIKRAFDESMSEMEPVKEEFKPKLNELTPQEQMEIIAVEEVNRRLAFLAETCFGAVQEFQSEVKLATDKFNRSMQAIKDAIGIKDQFGK